jgi:DNA-binding MarR family transcriptional regulator
MTGRNVLVSEADGALRRGAGGATTPIGKVTSELLEDRVTIKEALSLDAILPNRILKISKHVTEALSKAYTPHHLDFGEWEVLTALSGFKCATARDVGRRTAMHKTKISRAVKKLMQLNLVARCVNQADLRQAFLSLTPAGRDVYNRSAQAAQELAAYLDRAMHPTKREAFYHCFAELENCICNSNSVISTNTKTV